MGTCAQCMTPRVLVSQLFWGPEQPLRGCIDLLGRLERHLTTAKWETQGDSYFDDVASSVLMLTATLIADVSVLTYHNCLFTRRLTGVGIEGQVRYDNAMRSGTSTN